MVPVCRWCRRSYTVRDKETDVELDVDNQYIMSPKDLKTIHFMNKMMDAGVRVFKIEGRAVVLNMCVPWWSVIKRLSRLSGRYFH